MAQAPAMLRFDQVWKQFRRGSSHDSLRDLLPSVVRGLLRTPSDVSAPSKTFWALSDVSFEVEPGEILGIIGPNGAGKSTILKLLNGIMEPTNGVVEAEGKIGALIEVSAGFHVDLTGRQNVFLQGAIMGMRQKEVARKFDEIVEFAGIAEFIDTPVKRYSSGMNARLGFSIAAHLEPDVLIIDEVLAVGDHSFQQRAFERIKKMARAGAPVVLVSHQLNRIAELCTKCLLLDKGIIRTVGTPAHCINEYLHGMGAEARVGRLGDVGIQFADTISDNGLAVFSGEDLSLRVRGQADNVQPGRSWVTALRVIDMDSGEHVHTVLGHHSGVKVPLKGEFEYAITLQMNLPPGTYNIEPLVWDGDSRADVVSGKPLQVEVLERMKFWGQVQLNTRWTVIR